MEAVVLDLHPSAGATVDAARRNADALGIKLHVVRAHEAFHESVILPFCEAYRAGRTPNPCILCNPAVKFRLILRTADELDIAQIATGHYACLAQAGEHTLIKRADCLPRDQSYMLYRLGQAVLSRLLLPLQHLTKAEVRAVAENAGLPAAHSPDSQEICFIPNNDYPAYIEALYGKAPAGDFISPEGKPCGRHKGILHYTVGQRKGLGIALGRPVFVTGIDPAGNRIYLADSGDEYAAGVTLEHCVLQEHPFFAACGERFSCRVKIRSVAQPAPAVVTLSGDGAARVIFASPQRAPAPGQSVVWYADDETVLGGGFIAGGIPL